MHTEFKILIFSPLREKKNTVRMSSGVANKVEKCFLHDASCLKFGFCLRTWESEMENRGVCVCVEGHPGSRLFSSVWARTCLCSVFRVRGSALINAERQLIWIRCLVSCSELERFIPASKPLQGGHRVSVHGGGLDWHGQC